MAAVSLDVVGIGNAIVDVLASTDDTVLERFGLVKGSMRLCDESEAAQIYEAMGPGTEMSGGSVANTMVGIASLGGRAGFVGKFRDDQLGAVFAHDIRAAGVAFVNEASTTGPATASSLVLMTPDAQRTMNTFLGVSALLGPEDVPGEFVQSASVLMLEGYLWEEPSAKAAMQKSIELAHGAGNRVAFSLSDSFCVERNREEFLVLVRDSVDILFGNEAEICSLFSVDDFDVAAEAVRGQVGIGALTRGPAGSVLIAGDRTEIVAAAPVDEVVDTTGAGDAYAAGVLFGITSGRDLREAGMLGSIAAAEVISHVGSRPLVSLADLID